MSGFSFRQTSAAWQQKFQRQQAAGPLQRLLGWLILGVMLVAGMAVLLFMVVLSWLVIPILIYRYRKKMRNWQQAQQQGGTAESTQSNQVIEGEVLHKRED